MDFDSPRPLTDYQLEFLSIFHDWGGVSMRFYAAAYHSIGLINEETWNRDIQDVTRFRKNSLDAKETNLTLALIPVASS